MRRRDQEGLILVLDYAATEPALEADECHAIHE